MRDLLTTSSEKRENIVYINVNNIGPFQNQVCSLWHHTDLSHLMSCPMNLVYLFKAFLFQRVEIAV